VIVVDASVVFTALADDGPEGRYARQEVAGEQLFAPELIDLEVVSAWRRHARSGELSDHRVRQAIRDLREFPLVRASHISLLPRIWELRSNLTIYDAAYVALAELLDATLLTADLGIARAPGRRCETRVLASAVN
jgi:predicted nucleic acid-binding protein